MKNIERLGILIVGIVIGYSFFLLNDYPSFMPITYSDDCYLTPSKSEANIEIEAGQTLVSSTATNHADAESSTVAPIAATIETVDTHAIDINALFKDGQKWMGPEIDLRPLLKANFEQKQDAIANLSGHATTAKSFAKPIEISEQFYKNKGDDRSNAVLDGLQCSDKICAALFTVENKTDIKALNQYLLNTQVFGEGNHTQLQGQHDDGHYIMYLFELE